MTLRVLHTPTRTAVNTADSQAAQREAFLGGWAGQRYVGVHLYEGSTLLEAQLYDGFVQYGSDPLNVALGPFVARTHYVEGEADRVVLRNSSTDMLTVTADVGAGPAPTATFRLARPVTAESRPRLDAVDGFTGLVITMRTTLPLASTPTYRLTFALPDVATAGVTVAGSIVNTGNQPLPWSITPPSGVTVTPSSGTLAAGDTQALSVTAAAGTYTLTLVAAGATITGATQGLVASPAPSTATLSGSTAATTGIPLVSTVTLNAPADQPYTVTWARTGSTGPATSVIEVGQTSASTTSTWAATGAGSVDFTISPTITRAGNPLAVTVSAPPTFVAANEMRVSLPTGSEIDYPLQFGRAFRYGEFSYPQARVDGTPLTTQCDVKTRHADGSVKFAVVSVVLPTLGTTERVLTFQEHASPPTATALSKAAMLSDFDFDATIDVRVTGASLAGAPVSARSMLTALEDATLATETDAGGTGPRYWTRGPVCTTVLLHDHATKAYDFGKNATKAMRPVFIVQFWPGINRFHVRHSLEISDVTKLKEETGLQVIFSTGQASPVERLNQSNVNLFMGSFASRAYWGGAVIPRANVNHGLAYLSETQVIPNFNPAVTINAASLTSYEGRLATSPRGLGAVGDWQKSMSATGGRPDLGLFPKWDMLALCAGTAATHEYAEMHAEFAGWWNMHYREGSATKTVVPTVNGQGRVLSKMAGGRPTYSWFNVTPVPSDAFTRDGAQTSRDGWGADDAHTPGLYFAQYITTGSYFWHEKLLQLGAFSFFYVNPGTGYNSVANGRNSTDMVLNGVQTRSYGWQMRNRARAWWASIDNSPEKTLFAQAMDDGLAQRAGLHNIPGVLEGNPIRAAWDSNHATWWASIRGGMVSTPRPNAMGWFDCGVYDSGSDGFAIPSDGRSSTALWMLNYCAVSLAHAAELGHAASRPMAQWLGQAARQIANSTEPRHVADYVIPNVKLDGSFYQSPADIWATYANNADGAAPPSMPANSASGFPASGAPNTFGVTLEGYGTISASAIAMTAGADDGATAWAAVQPWHAASTFYNYDPRWSIIPRS